MLILLLPFQGVTRGESACTIAPSLLFFGQGPSIQGIISVVIQVMGSEYLDALKKANLDALEAKIQEATGQQPLTPHNIATGGSLAISLLCHPRYTKG